MNIVKYKIKRALLATILLGSAQFYMEAVFAASGFSVGGNGNLTINNAYTLPNADGTTNQILQTDGNGHTTWTTLTETLSTFTDNGDGTFTYTAEDGSIVTIGTVGATGAQGPVGNDGAVGATGAQGPVGDDGAVGATGAQGPAGNDGINGSVKDSMFAGYDIIPHNSFPNPVTSSTTFSIWNWTNSSYYGGAPVTIETGDKVLVNVSANLYKNDSVLSNTLNVIISPCYSMNSDFTSPIFVAPFSGRSEVFLQSIHPNDQAYASSRYEWTDLTTGTYYFSFCAKRKSASPAYANFSIWSPKVTVLVY